VATFPDETMLLLHEDVLGADEPGHVTVLDVVVRCRLRVGTLKEENNAIVKVLILLAANMCVQLFKNVCRTALVIQCPNPDNFDPLIFR